MFSSTVGSVCWVSTEGMTMYDPCGWGILGLQGKWVLSQFWRSKGCRKLGSQREELLTNLPLTITVNKRKIKFEHIWATNLNTFRTLCYSSLANSITNTFVEQLLHLPPLNTSRPIWFSQQDERKGANDKRILVMSHALSLKKKRKNKYTNSDLPWCQVGAVSLTSSDKGAEL